MRGTSGFAGSAAWLSPSVEGAVPSGLSHRLHPLPLQTGWPVAAYFFSSEIFKPSQVRNLSSEQPTPAFLSGGSAPFPVPYAAISRLSKSCLWLAKTAVNIFCEEILNFFERDSSMRGRPQNSLILLRSASGAEIRTVEFQALSSAWKIWSKVSVCSVAICGTSAPEELFRANPRRELVQGGPVVCGAFSGLRRVRKKDQPIFQVSASRKSFCKSPFPFFSRYAACCACIISSYVGRSTLRKMPIGTG